MFEKVTAYRASDGSIHETCEKAENHTVYLLLRKYSYLGNIVDNWRTIRDELNALGRCGS